MQSSVAVADFHAGIDGRLSSSPSGGGGRLRLLYPGCFLHRPVSGQSWPILDLTLGEFPGACAGFLLPSPLGAVRVRSDFAPTGSLFGFV